MHLRRRHRTRNIHGDSKTPDGLAKEPIEMRTAAVGPAVGSSLSEAVSVPRPFLSGMNWCLLSVAILEQASGQGLTALIVVMVAILRWLWVNRPIPNPYDSHPYNPDDPSEGM